MTDQAAKTPSKKVAPCPTLAGKTFNVYVGLGYPEPPVLDGTVKIAADLSYETSDGDTGQLVLDPSGSGNSRYTETDPTVTGALFCWGGVWYFLDDDADGSAGHIQIGTL